MRFALMLLTLLLGAVPAAGQQPPTLSVQGGPSITDWLLVLLTLVLAIVGATQAYIYARQKDVMQKALAATEESNKVAKESADAARRSADASMAMERPWLVVTLANAFMFHRQGEDDRRELRVFYVMTNYGRTPAWIGERRMSIIVLGNDDEPGPTLAPELLLTDDEQADCAKLPLAPGASDDQGCVATTVTLTETQVRTSSLRAMIYGTIEYRDVFGESRSAGFSWIMSWYRLDESIGIRDYGVSSNSAQLARGPEAYWRRTT